MTFQNVKVTRNDKTWEVEVKAEIPPESLDIYRTEALKEFQKTAKLDGFRQGHVPTDKILDMYGESAVMRLAAERAIRHELPELLAKEELLVIETPRVTTDTPESSKALSFEARAALAPKVELPDYQKIAQKEREAEEDVSVSDKEVEEAILHIRRERARIDKIESGIDSQKAAEEAKAIDEKDLPAIDDNFAQSIGYDNTEGFMSALKENIGSEKELRAQQKRRGTILTELIKESKIQYPVLLKEYELDEFEARLQEDLEHSGVSFEKYLADIKKTRDDLRKEWEKPAEERIKVRLILAEIAVKEKIEPDAEVLDHELSHALEHYPKADRNILRANIAHSLRNEMTLRFLEGNTEPVGHSHHEH